MDASEAKSVGELLDAQREYLDARIAGLALSIGHVQDLQRESDKRYEQRFLASQEAIAQALAGQK